MIGHNFPVSLDNAGGFGISKELGIGSALGIRARLGHVLFKLCRHFL